MPAAPAEAPRLRLVVRGVVQGVGFRWFVREQARAAHVAGWVRNNPDGSVELEAAGVGSALALLRAAVGRGPAGARVEQVIERPATPGAALPFPFTVDRP
jgi:acylphosphatase